MNSPTAGPTPGSTWHALAGSPLTDALLEVARRSIRPHECHPQAHRGVSFRFVPAVRCGVAAESLSHAADNVGRRWGLWVEDRKNAFPGLRPRSGTSSVSGPGCRSKIWRRDWRMCEALLTLHAIADEACAGLVMVLDRYDGKGCLYRARGRELLARTGALARIQSHSLRVLPKVH